MERDLAGGPEGINENDDVEVMWQGIKGVIMDTSQRHLKADRTRHKEWMTDEILGLIKEKRK